MKKQLFLVMLLFSSVFVTATEHIGDEFISSNDIQKYQYETTLSKINENGAKIDSVGNELNKANQQLGTIITFVLGGFFIGLFSSVIVFYFVADRVLKQYLEYLLKTRKLEDDVVKVVEPVQSDVKPLEPVKSEVKSL